MDFKNKNNFTKENINELIKFLKNENIRVSVFGEFSTGKSTLINAIINEEILSEDYLPTTAVPTIISYSDLFNISVKMKNEKIISLYNDDIEDKKIRKYIGKSDESFLNILKKKKKTIQTFISQWTKEGENVDEVHEVCIAIPHKLLKNKIALIDTPGKNNEFVIHGEFTDSVAKSTDIAILLTSARDGEPARTEYDFMNLVNKSVYKSFLAINFMDLKLNDKKEIIYETNEALKKHWENPILPEIFAISAKEQLKEKSDIKYSELIHTFNNLIIKIEKIIFERRGTILLDRSGNPEKQIYAKAQELEKTNEPNNIDTASDYYSYLREILITVNEPYKLADEGIVRCEKIQKINFKNINEIQNEIEKFEEKENSTETKYKEYLKFYSRLQRLGEEDKELKNKINELKIIIDERIMVIEILDNYKSKVQKELFKINKLGDFIKLYESYSIFLDEYFPKSNLDSKKQLKYKKILETIKDKIIVGLTKIDNDILSIEDPNAIKPKILFFSDKKTLKELKDKIKELEKIKIPKNFTMVLENRILISNQIKRLKKLIKKCQENIKKCTNIVNEINFLKQDMTKKYTDLPYNQDRLNRQLKNPENKIQGKTLTLYKRCKKIKNTLDNENLLIPLTHPCRKTFQSISFEVEKKLFINIKKIVKQLEESFEHTYTLTDIDKWIKKYSVIQNNIEDIVDENIEKLNFDSLNSNHKEMLNRKKNVHLFINSLKKYINAITDKIYKKNINQNWYSILDKNVKLLLDDVTKNFNKIKINFPENKIKVIEKFNLEKLREKNIVNIEIKVTILKNLKTSLYLMNSNVVSDIGIQKKINDIISILQPIVIKTQLIKARERDKKKRKREIGVIALSFIFIFFIFFSIRFVPSNKKIHIKENQIHMYYKIINVLKNNRDVKTAERLLKKHKKIFPEKKYNQLSYYIEIMALMTNKPESAEQKLIKNERYLDRDMKNYLTFTLGKEYFDKSNNSFWNKKKYLNSAKKIINKVDENNLSEKNKKICEMIMRANY